MSALTIIFLSVLFGYLLGSIPFGLVLTKMAGLGDIRTVGSGNIGATNVLRTGRKDLALATLLLDSGKGALAVGAAHLLGLHPEAAGTAAFVGHCFPAWLKFQRRQGGCNISRHPPRPALASRSDCIAHLVVRRFGSSTILPCRPSPQLLPPRLFCLLWANHLPLLPH